MCNTCTNSSNSASSSIGPGTIDGNVRRPPSTSSFKLGGQPQTPTSCPPHCVWLFCLCGAKISVTVTPTPASFDLATTMADVAGGSITAATTPTRPFTTTEVRCARWAQVHVRTLKEAMEHSMKWENHPNTNKIRQQCTVPQCEDTVWCYPGMPVVVCWGCFEDAAVDSPEIVKTWTIAVHNFAQEFEFRPSSSLRT